MRGTVAKRLRKQAYGDRVTKASARVYGDNKGTIVCLDDRTFYQDLKKEHRRTV